MKLNRLIVMLWTALLFIYSCSSGEVLIQKKLTGSEQILGKAKGEGCGSMWIISTAYNFIPIGLNGRIQTAYDNALNSVSGAKGLINISIEETWTWYVLGTARCTTITGDAVK